MMNARQRGAAALCRTMALPICIVTLLASDSVGGELGGLPVIDNPAPAVVADTVPAPPATPIDSAVTIQAEPADAPGPAPAATTVTATAEKAEAIVEAALGPALGKPAQMPVDPMPVQEPAASPPDAAPPGAASALESVEILDECWVVDACVDRYLWALYQRAPKEDTIRVPERRQVTIKKKRKTVTVMRTFTKLVDDDFTWKDPKAAARAGMSMPDYVIGGVDRSFKLKLFRALLAAERAGLSPGITSAFRDDYRQSIASGLAAASNRSFHGGSLRGGYRHGLAADVVSVSGATRDARFAASLKLWKWLDAHGKEFGVGRPYLGRDPAHLAPIDGGEYISRRGTGTRTYAGLDVKKRAHHHGAKRAGSAKPSKVTTIRSARRT